MSASVTAPCANRDVYVLDGGGKVVDGSGDLLLHVIPNSWGHLMTVDG